MAKPCIHNAITVTTSNNKLDFDLAGGELTATLTAGLYTDLWTFAAHVQTQVRAVGGGTETVTVVTTGVAGRITINLQASGRLRWATGTNTLVTCGELLGFDVSANDTGASSYTSNYQAPGSWWSTRHPKTGSDRYERRSHIGSKPLRSLDGTKTYRLTVAKPRRRKVEIEHLPAEVMWADAATSANTNRDFETFWQTAIESASVRYYPDQTSSATYTTCYLVGPSDLAAVRDMYADTEVYAVELELNRQET